MFTVISEEGSDSKSPQRRGNTEEDGSQDSGDAGPERRSLWNAAQLVSEDTEQFEEPCTGVKVSYTLEEQEIYQLLKKIHYAGKKKRLYIIEFLLIFILFVFYIICAARFAQSPFLRISFVSCGALLAALTALFAAKPAVCSRAEARKAGGREIRMEVYPDHIEAYGGAGQLEIQLDGSCYRLETDSMLAVFTGEAVGARVFPIPLSRLDPSVLPEVQAMIAAGTRRREWSEKR